MANPYLSLLMAVAVAPLTRMDLAVLVIALQRHSQTPQVLRVRRLRAIVRWAQRHPLVISYKRMTCARALVANSDAGFRNEEREGLDQGRAARGAYFVRLATRAKSGNAADFPCHLLGWACNSLQLGTRSTFTSETQASVMATDHAMPL